MIFRYVVVASALLLGSCQSTPVDDGASGIPDPSGPPQIQYDVVRRHAQQFDVDIPSRPPGSQLELAAASYILGHLQLAGYSPRLDRVPVADQVTSTNVVAFPPAGSEPEYLVMVAYDTPLSDKLQRSQHGPEIGLFLELARALAVAEPEHRVAFVALGAESAEHRGTRRLARFLLDEGVEPSVLWIVSGERGGESIGVSGSCQGPGSGWSQSFTDEGCVAGGSDGLAITAAGFQQTRIKGDTDRIGAALFDFLTRAES